MIALIERERQRRHRRHLTWWLALGGIPIALAGAWIALRPGPVPVAARFRMQAVSQGDLVREVRATGRIEAVTTVQVGAEISGRIATVEVDYNARVKAGQVLARFDRAALGAQLAQTAATLAAARAALEQARTDRERTAGDLARAEQLHARAILADADYRTAVATARLNEQRVTAAEAQLAAQQAAYTVARTNLDHTVIRAPIDGVVITRNIDPGQTVASMLQTPVLFTVAADLRQMRVVAAVDEADIGELAVAQPVSFTVDAYPDRVFHGLLTEVRNSPVVVQDVVTYGAVVGIDNHDLALKPGMTASVRVQTASAAHVLRVPNAALRFTPPGQTGRDAPGVWVLEGGAVHRVVVQPGISDGESTVIAPGGLAVGAQVIVDLTPEGRDAYGAGR
ncbi:MAG: efflux RND transporter periplasmic adaptor subunit [Acidobacteriota bacterium]